MGRIRSIFTTLSAEFAPVLRRWIGIRISALMMLLAIAYVVAIMIATMKWLDARWLALTVPAGLVIAFPMFKWMAHFSQRITKRVDRFGIWLN